MEEEENCLMKRWRIRFAITRTDGSIKEEERVMPAPTLKRAAEQAENKIVTPLMMQLKAKVTLVSITEEGKEDKNDN